MITQRCPFFKAALFWCLNALMALRRVRGKATMELYNNCHVSLGAGMEKQKESWQCQFAQKWDNSSSYW
ncbi:hypothetical protein L248_2823 [Schleiferilactobacillus shenzhenensis LY-73]|uniref:Secreted protein n=1 Tax=Schleiferilactobacillus shenzhenensis LY-73 TaxID=1231336 RepID=U4TMJ6_9LACO|nr:hypothetical protein L248_2823 [Schleiferilactobacillus shenzhenensis LY-73]